MKSEKYPVRLESSVVLKGTLGRISKENLALNCSFQGCSVVNVALSIKKNCLFFPAICGSKADTRRSINVGGCNAFRCL